MEEDAGESLLPLVWKEPINGKTAFFTEQVYRQLMGPEPSLVDKVSWLMDALKFPPASTQDNSSQRDDLPDSGQIGVESSSVPETSHAEASSCAVIQEEASSSSPSFHSQVALDNTEMVLEESKEARSLEVADTPASPDASPGHLFPVNTDDKLENRNAASAEQALVTQATNNGANLASVNNNTNLASVNSNTNLASVNSNTNLQSVNSNTNLASVNSNTNLQSVNSNTNLQSVNSNTNLQSVNSNTNLQSVNSKTNLQSVNSKTNLQTVNSGRNLFSVGHAVRETDGGPVIQGTSTNCVQQRGAACADSQVKTSGTMDAQPGFETSDVGVKWDSNSERTGPAGFSTQHPTRLYDKIRRPAIPEAPKSSLSHEQHKRYLHLFSKYMQRFFRGGFTQPPTQAELKELQEFEILQLQVGKEQEQCQAYLQQVSEHSPSLYTHLPTHFTHYIQEREQSGWKRAETYCRYYSIEDHLSLTPDLSQMNSAGAPTPMPTLKLVQTLLELGSKCKMVMPDMSPKPNSRARRTVVTDMQKVSSRFPPVHSSSQGVWNHEPASKDSNLESLVRKYPCCIATSASVLKQLVDNHGPDFSVAWDIPVVIRDCGNGSVSRKVVYLDKPLLPAVTSLSKRKALYLNKALRAYVCRPHDDPKSAPLRTRNPASHGQGEATQPVESTHGRSVKTVQTEEEDDPFGSASMEDLETFGSVKMFSDKKRRASATTTDISKQPASQPPKSCRSEGSGNKIPPLIKKADEKDTKETTFTSDTKTSSANAVKKNSSELKENTDEKTSQHETKMETEMIPKESVASTDAKSSDTWEQDTDSDMDALVIADSSPFKTPQKIPTKQHTMMRRSQDSKPSILNEITASASLPASSKNSSPKQSVQSVSSLAMIAAPDQTQSMPSSPGLSVSGPLENPSQNQTTPSVEASALTAYPDSASQQVQLVRSRRITRSVSQKLLSSGESGGEGGGDCSDFSSPDSVTPVSPRTTQKSSKRKTPEVKLVTTGQGSEVDSGTDDDLYPACQAKKARWTADQGGRAVAALKMGEAGRGVEMEEKKADGSKIAGSEKTTKSGEKQSVNSTPSYLDSLLNNMTPMSSGGRVRLQEDPSHYQSPGGWGDQVSYHLWDLAGMSLIVRCNGHAFVRDSRQQRAVYVSAKLERQMPHGVEQNTFSESVRAWMSCHLRPNSYLLRARVNVQNYEVVHTEELQLNQILQPTLNFSPQYAFAVLKSIFSRLTELPVGSYLLSHDAGTNYIALKSGTTMRRGSHDLRSRYIGLVMQQPDKGMCWIPVDPTIVLPHHWRLSLIPATFQPADFQPKRKQQQQQQHGPQKQYYKKKHK